MKKGKQFTEICLCPNIIVPELCLLSHIPSNEIFRVAFHCSEVTNLK